MAAEATFNLKSLSDLAALARPNHHNCNYETDEVLLVG